MSGVQISSISNDSPAERSGLRVGDVVLTINGRAPTDIIEYQQMVDDANPVFVLQRDGEELQRRVIVTKAAGEKVGLSIDSAIFDRIRTCDNHCTFCFIYQLPKGLRRSLYVKDDDFRLSFLYGNYTTLTRFTEFDLERVISEGLSPLYVSIHTTNPQLRGDMLRNPRGATSLRWLHALLDANIVVHGQVVLCPEINDGIELTRTLEDILTHYSRLESVSIVPIGISAFSAEATMREHSEAEAREVIAQVQEFCNIGEEMFGRKFIFASDEFYLIAGLSPPSADELPSLDEAENGVGLVAAFEQSFRLRASMAKLGSGFFQSVDGATGLGYRAPRFTEENPLNCESQDLILLTGEYAAPLLRELLAEYGYSTEVIGVENRYFGGNIKVAGLLTATDLGRVISERGLEHLYAIPDLCLSENRFLDGLSLSDVPGNVVVVETTGAGLRKFLDAHSAPGRKTESLPT
jgi:putative radical SAM enzyme (TIGR03279 family)